MSLNKVVPPNSTASPSTDITRELCKLKVKNYKLEQCLTLRTELKKHTLNKKIYTLNRNPQLLPDGP